MNSNELWSSRFSLFIQELQKYLRYIFNGHLLFVLIIGLGGLAYYYSEWVKTLDHTFPAALILAVIIAIPLTNSPIYTLLKEPDMFFLLPIEKQLAKYFNKSIRLSFVVQSYVLLMFLAAAMPLYAAVENGAFSDFFWILALLMVAKYMNLRLKWSMLKYQDVSSRLWDSGVRYCVNFALIYVTLSKAGVLYILLVLVLLAAITLYFNKVTQHKLLQWDTLISLESKRMLTFYRFANLFTDVPKLKEKISRRKWLDPLLSTISYKHENAYMYLYMRTFIRSSDYLGLFVRLTIIGILVLCSLTSLLPQLLGAGLFVYITGFQLIVLRKQHENLIWHDLYPIREEIKNKEIQRILVRLLVLQSLIFAVVGLITNGLSSLGAIIVVCIVIILLLRSYYAKVVRAAQDKWD
ncbi:ABC transporter permease [Bacillus massiliigorillae]|uniref:ABC transporter permease n=1 Tax=Bacillus massiliigorillae TaxID=1243664 RepID=UPI0003A8DCD6|nr:ABC transporter permease [Bacillus massiliigorillae]